MNTTTVVTLNINYTPYFFTWNRYMHLYCSPGLYILTYRIIRTLLHTLPHSFILIIYWSVHTQAPLTMARTIVCHFPRGQLSTFLYQRRYLMLVWHLETGQLCYLHGGIQVRSICGMFFGILNDWSRYQQNYTLR